MSEPKDYTTQEEQKNEADQEEAAREEQKGSSPGTDLSNEELSLLCQERICPQCPERMEMDQQMLRVRADAENFRKRMSREKEQFCKYATESILEEIVPVLDNLELALQHGKDVQACKELVQGVDMTNKMLLETLQKHGLEQVYTEKGDEFDPTWQEAVAQEERSDLESGYVCQIMQKGYKIRDRLLRPAKVIVSKKCES